MKSTPYSYQILMTLVFFQQIFKKYSNIKFQGNLSVEDRLFHVGRQTEANSHFSQFCKHK